MNRLPWSSAGQVDQCSSCYASTWRIDNLPCMEDLPGSDVRTFGFWNTLTHNEKVNWINAVQSGLCEEPKQLAEKTLLWPHTTSDPHITYLSAVLDAWESMFVIVWQGMLHSSATDLQTRKHIYYQNIHVSDKSILTHDLMVSVSLRVRCIQDNQFTSKSVKAMICPYPSIIADRCVWEIICWNFTGRSVWPIHQPYRRCTDPRLHYDLCVVQSRFFVLGATVVAARQQWPSRDGVPTCMADRTQCDDHPRNCRQVFAYALRLYTMYARCWGFVSELRCELRELSEGDGSRAFSLSRFRPFMIRNPFK